MKVNIDEVASILGIGKEHIPMLVGSFLDEAKGIMEELKVSSASSDYVNIALHAHSIKGSAANLRLSEVSEQALIIEHAAKASSSSCDYVQETQKLQEFIGNIEI